LSATPRVKGPSPHDDPDVPSLDLLQLGQGGMRSLEDLPQELFLHIATWIDVQDVYRLRQVPCIINIPARMPASTPAFLHRLQGTSR
jgi:hypothetical protein